MSNPSPISIDDRLALEARCDAYFEEKQRGPVQLQEFLKRTGDFGWRGELFLQLAVEEIESLAANGIHSQDTCLSGRFVSMAQELGHEDRLADLYGREFVIRSRAQERLLPDDFVSLSECHVTVDDILDAMAQAAPITVKILRNGRLDGTVRLLHRLTFGRRHSNEPEPMAVQGPARDARIIVAKDLYVSRTQLVMERLSIHEVAIENRGSKLSLELNSGNFLKPTENGTVRCGSVVEFYDVRLTLQSDPNE